MKLIHFGFIFLFLIIASVNATYIGEISTDDLEGVQYFANDSIVELEGFDFVVPKGFGLIENESVDHVEGNYTESERFFANDGGEIIIISTTSVIRQDLILSDYAPCDVDLDKKTINGHEGIQWSMDNGTYFIYFDDGSLITVGASNSSYLEYVISN